MRQDRAATAPEYERDFFAWTQHQARLLRILRRGPAELPPGLDLDRVAEEIEDVGKAELNSTRSLIRQILVHVIKAVCDPEADAVNHWRAEASTMHADLLDVYAPSMRQLIDMDRLWKTSIKLADARLREHGAALAPGLPAQSPFDVADMVAEDFSFDAALARLRAAQAAA